MSSFVTYQDVQGPGVPGHQSQRYGFVSLQSDAGICTSLMRWAAPCWMEVLGGVFFHGTGTGSGTSS